MNTALSALQCLGPLCPAHQARLAANPAVAGMTAPRRRLTLARRFPDFDSATLQLLTVRAAPQTQVLRMFIWRYVNPELLQLARRFNGPTLQAADGEQGISASHPCSDLGCTSDIGNDSDIRGKLQQIPDRGICVAQACLQMDPEKRATCEQLQRLPYFAGTACWFTPEFHGHQVQTSPN